MSKPRDLHHSSIIVGRKGTGKSTLTNGLAMAYPKDKKVLIFDVNMSPAYNQHPVMQLKDIPRWRSGIAKMYGVPDKNTLGSIAQNFRDGLIVWEDCTKYIEGNVPPEIKGFLVDHRMYRCDMVFTFHALRRVPPFFWEMSSYLVLLKTQDELDIPRNRGIIPNYNEVLSAYKRVNAHKDNFYNETIQTFV